MPSKTRTDMRAARHRRVRKRISGTPERPRLTVFKSLKHVSAQIIDDTAGNTLAAASTQEKDLKAPGNKEGAKIVGQAIAERARKKGIETVVFDRAGFKYHGIVASLADGARGAGLKF